MNIGLIFLMSLVTVAAFLVLAIRTIGLRWVLRHATIIDVIFTLVVCITLAGTLTGLLIGILAGLVLTGTLTILRWLQDRADDLRARMAKPVEEKEDWSPGGSPERL